MFDFHFLTKLLFQMTLLKFERSQILIFLFLFLFVISTVRGFPFPFSNSTTGPKVLQKRSFEDVSNYPNEIYEGNRGQSVVYPSPATVSEDNLDNEEEEEEEVEVAENKPPEISRMPSSFYRRPYGNFGSGYNGYRPRMGNMDGDNSEGYYNYRGWGPRPYPRNYGRGVSSYGPNDEDSYPRGYGMQGHYNNYNNYGESGGSGCGSFRCMDLFRRACKTNLTFSGNQNGGYGQNTGNGGDGCGPMGCSRGLRPGYPYMGGMGGMGGSGGQGPGSAPSNMMGRIGGGMWGSNNFGGNMENNNEMGMGGMGMGGGEGPPSGGVSFFQLRVVCFLFSFF